MCYERKESRRLRATNVIILTYPWRLQVRLNVVKTLQPLGRSYEKYILKPIVREFLGWSTYVHLNRVTSLLIGFSSEDCSL